MRKLLAITAAGVLAGTLMTAASAQPSAQPPARPSTPRGNPREGRRLASERCETCHIVAADQQIKPLVSNYGPSFQDVANRPGLSAASIESFLLHLHRFGHMPFPDLTAAQAADLASYILSLRGRR